MFGVVIDKISGFVVDKCVLLDVDNNPLYYILKENEQVITFENNNPITEFINAKRNFETEKWIEGATAEEITEQKDSQQSYPTPLTTEERLAIAEQALNDMMMIIMTI